MSYPESHSVALIRVESLERKLSSNGEVCQADDAGNYCRDIQFRRPSNAAGGQLFAEPVARRTNQMLDIGFGIINHHRCSDHRPYLRMLGEADRSARVPVPPKYGLSASVQETIAFND